MPALFFSTGTPTTDTYTLSLHDALPISAADKDRRGELIELRELADGVEHDDVGPGLGVDRQLGAAGGDKPGLARDALGLGEALRRARRENADGVRLRPLDLRERAQHRRLLIP